MRTAIDRRALVCIVLPVVLTACNRDEAAPDCFLVDADGVCQIPSPIGGGGGDRVRCEMLPEGAVAAQYAYVPDINGDVSDITGFSATGLPTGLSIDVINGQISGIPTEAGTFEVTIAYNDESAMQDDEVECGPLVINEPLNASPLLENKPNFPCVEVGDVTSKADLLALLGGGDGSAIDFCAVVPDMDPEPFETDTCPHDDGNGLLPPGVTVDPETCAIEGDVDDEFRHVGTWAWMTIVEQSGAFVAVPYCYTVPIAGSAHAITYDSGGELDIEGERPYAVTIPAATQLPADDPNREYLSFGGADPNFDPLFTVTDAACGGAPCTDMAYDFTTYCSPYDDPAIPFANVAQITDGFTHPMFGE